MSKSNYQATNIDQFDIVKSAPAAFTGTVANTRGDRDGSLAAFPIFTVTGEVLVRIFGVCTVVLAGASAKLEIGVTGNTAFLIAQTTATDIDANEIWNDTSPAIGDTLASVLGPFIIPNGLDIIETASDADVTSGNVHYICLWRALSPDGNVIAA